MRFPAGREFRSIAVQADVDAGGLDKLWPGMKIGQLCFFRLTSPTEHPYGSTEDGSHYPGQRGPTPSPSHLNFHRTPI